jgi:hypothetical protein
MRLIISIAILAIASSAYASSAPKPAPGVLTKRKMQEVAYELVGVMNADGSLKRQTDEMINAQLATMKDMPCAAQAEGQLREVLSEALNYEAMRGDIANIYATNLTLDELNWMIDFYKTGLGVKMLKVQPVVYETMSSITTTRMKAAEPKIAAIFGNLEGAVCFGKGKR